MTESQIIKSSGALAAIRLSDFKTLHDAKPVVAKLRQVIAFHDKRYYQKNKPVITDVEYDKLFRLLRGLEEKFPVLLTRSSPTQRVASDISKKLKVVKHLTPMLSLDNTYHETDLREFDRRIKTATGTGRIEYTTELKYDGAGISLLYESDRFVQGLTRGDGISGEDISNNLLKLESLPLSAPFSKSGIGRIEIRGEILIARKKFREINAAREADGLETFANPRNAAAGSIRLLDPGEAGKRGLEVFVYQISLAEDRKGKNILLNKLRHHENAIRVLHDCGFNTPFNEIKVCNDIGNVQRYCEHWQEKRDRFPYEIDGIVIKVNDLSLYDTLGFTSHHPRWAIAYKFKPRQAVSMLEHIEYQVGRTGVITPVAKLRPVTIGGVRVSSASLHNEDYIRTKDIRIGDHVLVERAGDVIPYVSKALTQKRTGAEKKITFPKKCPSCNSRLIRLNGEATLRCVNAGCPVQSMERIGHFVSKQAMDIDGLGRSTIELFFSKGLLKSITGIYHLDFDRIRKLRGFGEKSIRNLQEAIEKSKEQPVYRLINGLGIRMVGETGARKLAERIRCVDELSGWSVEKLQSIDGIGDKVAEGIYDFFHTSQNRKTIAELRKAGVRVCEKEKPVTNKGHLRNLKFVFTGTLDSLTREDARDLAIRNGASVSDSISSNVDYLVAGKQAGSKLDKARKSGTIKIINEQQFLKLLRK